MNASNDRQLLSQDEPELVVYEKIVEEKFKEGWRNFFEAGQALGQILEAKLYLARSDTFEEYCQHRWQCSASRARQFIGAAQVVTNLKEAKSVTIVTLPTHESQVRPLVGLPPSRQCEAWVLATEKNPNPTAATVQAALQSLDNQQANPGITIEIFADDDQLPQDGSAETFVSKRPVKRALGQETACLQYRERIGHTLRRENSLQEFFEKLDEGEILTGPSDLKVFSELTPKRMKELLEHVLKTSTFKEAQAREAAEDNNQGEEGALDDKPPAAPLQSKESAPPIWNKEVEEALAWIEKLDLREIAQAMRNGTLQKPAQEIIGLRKLLYHFIEQRWSLKDWVLYERKWGDWASTS